MPLSEPRWWYQPGKRGGVRGALLEPLAKLYGAVAMARYEKAKHYRPNIPVICVGNLTAGGTGKTPMTRLICERLVHMGETPAVLTRGYGGRLSGPHWVNASMDSARDVGDEPIELAADYPVLVAKDRAKGAREIESRAHYSVIVMDDGLINGSLAKDCKIAVVDGARGLGNAEVIPAGPLRAPLDFQLKLVDCIVFNGGVPGNAESSGMLLEDLKRHFPGPVLEASVTAVDSSMVLTGERVLTYAGIGHPERFFRLVASAGAEIVGQSTFPDHHRFSEAEAQALLNEARAKKAQLLTTGKDYARLSGATGACAELKSESRPVRIRVSMDGGMLTRLDALIAAALVRSGR